MDKIDIRGLRVGNWVYYDPNVFIEDEYEPTKDVEIVKIQNSDDIGLAIDECYSPIPLTKEILEKNRWKKQPLPSTNKETCIGIWRDSKSCTTVKQFFLDRNSSIFVLIGGYSKVGNIKYVHQLQNILIDLGI